MHDSPSLAYAVPAGLANEVFNSIPPLFKRKPRPLRWAIRQAIARIAEDTDCTHEEAAEILGQKILAYAASPEGLGAYRRTMVVWLADDGFDEPEEAWTREDEAAKARAAARSSAVESEVARRRREWSEQAQAAVPPPAGFGDALRRREAAG